jgi:hypothetical protein
MFRLMAIIEASGFTPNLPVQTSANMTSGKLLIESRLMRNS